MAEHGERVEAGGGQRDPAQRPAPAEPRPQADQPRRRPARRRPARRSSTRSSRPPALDSSDDQDDHRRVVEAGLGLQRAGEPRRQRQPRSTEKTAAASVEDTHRAEQQRRCASRVRAGSARPAPVTPMLTADADGGQHDGQRPAPAGRPSTGWSDRPRPGSRPARRSRATWVSSASSNWMPSAVLARAPCRCRGRAAGWAARAGWTPGPRDGDEQHGGAGQRDHLERHAGDLRSVGRQHLLRHRGMIPGKRGTSRSTPSATLVTERRGWGRVAPDAATSDPGTVGARGRARREDHPGAAGRNARRAE